MTSFLLMSHHISKLLTSFLRGAVRNICIDRLRYFSIYVDAPEELLQTWYINRFLKFREGAFTNPDSYFHNYAKLSEDEAINTATSLWKEINWLNLKQNILPTRERASLIMTKSANHAVEQVRLRK